MNFILKSGRVEWLIDGIDDGAMEIEADELWDAWLFVCDDGVEEQEERKANRWRRGETISL